MSAVTRRRQPAGSAETLQLAALGAALAACGVLWCSAKLAGVPSPGNPFVFILDLVTGKLAWTVAATWTAVTLGCCAVAAPLAAVIIYRARPGRRHRVDRAAVHMARGRELRPLLRPHAQTVARRLGVTPPGIEVARSVIGSAPLYLTWEQTALVIAGPRTMKTSAVAVPAIMQAPGAVVVTTNKRDVIDATRQARQQHGFCWVFDPQRVVEEPARFWFNPLDAVQDEQTAAELAAIFTESYRRPGERRDPFFDTQGQLLLSGFLLALVCGQRPITDMHHWLTHPNDQEAVDLLRRAGWEAMAASTAKILNTVPRQRDGVFDTARNATTFLLSPQICEWITPTAGRTHFDAVAFVSHSDTLYCASQEGPGNAGAVVGALTVLVMRAAERLARRSPGGRLPVPMLCVLDEAANVCRWPMLPQVTSHYGSRGINLLTILQSYSQGADVWGEHGMDTLWTAANLRLYGGGSADVQFLQRLSNLIGEYRPIDRSATAGRGSRSYTTSASAEPVLDASDLAAIPAGRAVLFPSGTRPVLVRTTPWMADRRWRDAVQDSIAEHDPAASAHLAELTARG